MGESIPVASGGREVASAIQTPPIALPISIAQITVAMPAERSPGNMSPPNEMMLAMRTTAASTPAITSLKISELLIKGTGYFSFQSALGIVGPMCCKSELRRDFANLFSQMIFADSNIPEL